MPSTRTKALGAAVLALGLAQILYEDVLVFLGVTDSLPTKSPYVMVAVPLLISVTLAVLLLGAAIRSADSLR